MRLHHLLPLLPLAARGINGHHLGLRIVKADIVSDDQWREGQR